MVKLAILALLGFGTATALRAHPNHEGKYAWFAFDEGPTNGKCKNVYQCDGLRTCSEDGQCTGEARPSKGPEYQYNEALTGGRCWQQDEIYSDYFCDGERMCSQSGRCKGKAR